MRSSKAGLLACRAERSSAVRPTRMTDVAVVNYAQLVTLAGSGRMRVGGELLADAAVAPGAGQEARVTVRERSV